MACRPLARWLLAGCLLACNLLAGCGESSGGRLALSGTVTFDGQPVEGGSIAFLPEGADEGLRPKPGGPIEGGRYAIPARKGALPGTYRVEIRWPKKTGKQVPFEDTGILKDETVEVIPARCNTASTLKVEVRPDATTFDFPLQSQ